MFKKVQNISLLGAHDPVADIFLLKEKKGIQDYASGSKWRFGLRVGDASAELDLKYWGNENKEEIAALYDGLEVGDVLFVQGRVSEFNGVREISVNHGSGAIKRLKVGEFAPDAFLKKGKKDAEALFGRVLSLIEEIKDEEFRRILQAFFHNQEFAAAFKLSPASLFRHHNYCGGLLEHSLSVAKICLDVSSREKRLDKELLICGALLHDIGKIPFFKVRESIEISKQGQLLGSVVLGLELFSEKTKDLGISSEKDMKLRHILASSLGRKSYGAAKQPASSEALLISHAKLLDAKVGQMLDVKESALAEDAEKFFYHKDFGNIFLE